MTTRGLRGIMTGSAGRSAEFSVFGNYGDCPHCSRQIPDKFPDKNSGGQFRIPGIPGDSGDSHRNSQSVAYCPSGPAHASAQHPLFRYSQRNRLKNLAMELRLLVYPDEKQ
jgi:hypothetical protein